MLPWFKSACQKMTRSGSSVFFLVGTVSGFCALNHHSTETCNNPFVSQPKCSRAFQRKYNRATYNRDTLLSQSNHDGMITSTRSQIMMATSASSSATGRNENVGLEDDVAKLCLNRVRTYSTDADVYYEANQQIPLPRIMHDSLDDMIQRDGRSNTNEDPNEATMEAEEQGRHPERILVIGDVHGCYSEMKSLVHKASIEYNGNKPFTAVVLVGDLCNKGPYSAEVIRHVRNQRHWFSVRGNHDNAALQAALGDEKRRTQEKYKWTFKLSDDDVEWLSNLPYTITIPNKMLGCYNSKREEGVFPASMDTDIVVVHAGLIPNVPLNEQSIPTMTTIRKVTMNDEDGSYEYQPRGASSKLKKMEENTNERTQTSNTHVQRSSYPWAKAWNGPQQIIFGHDAKRGYQNEALALGLDEGCCYGKKLTGIILPDGELVSVNAEKVHCPIK